MVETEGDATLVSNSRLTALCCRARFRDQTLLADSRLVSDVGSVVVLCHLLECARGEKLPWAAAEFGCRCQSILGSPETLSSHSSCQQPATTNSREEVVKKKLGMTVAKGM